MKEVLIIKAHVFVKVFLKGLSVNFDVIYAHAFCVAGATWSEWKRKLLSHLK